MAVMESLDPSLTMYQLNISNQDTIALKTAMFEVILKESSEIEAAQQKNKGIGPTSQKNPAEEVQGLKILVFDHWKVKELKDAYSGESTLHSYRRDSCSFACYRF